MSTPAPVAHPASPSARVSTQRSVSRRGFLRAAGVGMSLPFLDAMRPAFQAVTDAWVAKSPRNKELLGLVQAELVNVRAGR